MINIENCLDPKCARFTLSDNPACSNHFPLDSRNTTHTGSDLLTEQMTNYIAYTYYYIKQRFKNRDGENRKLPVDS